jgi:hypothetical protein
VYALVISGEFDEALAASKHLPAAAEATDNPHMQSQGLLAYGFANTVVNPTAAADALTRGLAIARDSGNRQQESHQALLLARIVAAGDDPVDALALVGVSLRIFYNSGNFSLVRSPLAILVAVLDRLGRHTAAATIAGFAYGSLTSHAFPELHTAIAHLRDVLGVEGYESLAAQGESMSNSQMAAYAFAQIDDALADLELTAEETT